MHVGCYEGNGLFAQDSLGNSNAHYVVHLVPKIGQRFDFCDCHNCKITT